MNKIKTIFILGIWLAILPYLGFPYSLKNILYSITGLVFIYISYSLYRDKNPKTGESKEKTFENFSENKNFDESEIKIEEQIEANTESNEEKIL